MHVREREGPWREPGADRARSATGDPDLFERLRFIRGVHNGFVEFNDHGWHQELVRDRITTADVQWACDLLTKLSDALWADAFRAGGYEPTVAQRFIRRLKAKIDEGRNQNR